MPTERIGDIEKSQKICLDPDHYPPKYRVFENGKYKHICPRCGNVTYFTVNSPTWNASREMEIY